MPGIIAASAALVLLSAGCTPVRSTTFGSVADEAGATSGRVPRVLVVVADDMSPATTPMYAADFPTLDAQVAQLPTLQALCDNGVRFTRAWSAPTCTPTRATMLTGRYGFRTGIGSIFGMEADQVGIDIDEPTLPRLLDQHHAGVAHAAFGKWGLGYPADLDGALAPNTMGWSHYAGLLGDVPQDYYAWQRTENGVSATSTDYITTKNVDDTISWLSQQDPDQGFVAWLAFSAPHSPFHAPPADLLGDDAVPDDAQAIADDPLTYYHAASQAMDAELARLLAWLDSNGMGDVDVIFVGDNGDPIDVAQPDWWATRGKGTTYEGGVHVPLCVAGPSVAGGGRTSDALVGTVDLPATVLDLVGLSSTEVMPSDTFDSRSFAPVLTDPSAQAPRTWNYTETFGNVNVAHDGRAVRTERYKLMVFEEDGREELFDLAADPFEVEDLLARGDFDSAASYDDDDQDDDDQGEDHDADQGEDHEDDEQEEAAVALDELRSLLENLDADD